MIEHFDLVPFLSTYFAFEFIVLQYTKDNCRMTDDLKSSRSHCFVEVIEDG